MIIRPESDDDRGEIERVVGAAFGSDVEPALVARIRASDEYVPELALVAERDGRVVGHVMVSGASLRSSDGVRPIVLLAPLAVDPACQRDGIGGALVREVTRRAQLLRLASFTEASVHGGGEVVYPPAFDGLEEGLEERYPSGRRRKIGRGTWRRTLNT